MPTPPSTTPFKITAGAKVDWTRFWDSYGPNDGYTATITLKKKDETGVDIEATDNGDNSHLFTWEVADTAGLATGTWHYQIWLTDEGDPADVRYLESGFIDIFEDLSAAADAYDPRSFNEKMLDALETLLEGKPVKGDQLSYTFENVSITRLSYPELNRATDTYRARVKADRGKNRRQRGHATGRKVIPRI